MPSISHTPLETRLEVQKLKSLPAMSLVVNQFLEACADRDIAMTRLAQIIEKDPSLLARIIGVANSAFYSPAEPVATAEEAIFQVLGVDMARNLALGIILSGPFTVDKCPNFPLGRFWLESVLTATLAHDLAAYIAAEKKCSPGDAYLAGLLHSFGLLVLVHLYPDEMNRIIGESRNCCGSLELVAAEQEVLQTNHLEVGAWLGRKWHLPEKIVVVMEQFLNSSYRGDVQPLVPLISFSTRWASSKVFDDSEKESLDIAELLPLGIDEVHATKVLAKVEAQLDSLRALAHQFSKG